MKVLVTGGAGFIGSHVSERLLRLGHQVAILDDLNDYYSPARKRRNLDSVSKAGPVRFHEGDIRDAAAVARAMEEKPEAVIHLAARAGVRPSLVDPLLYESVNVGGTIQLLEAARQNGVRKFVLASSSSIYGIANRVPFSEDDNVNLPISPYAATKIAAEKVCFTYSHLYGLNVACLRFFTVYGPRQRPDLAIHKFTKLLAQGKPIPVFGDGSMGRDYTYIDDIVSGVVAALEYDCRFEVFNLGNSHPVLLTQLISTLECALEVKAGIDRMPEQPGDVPITYADISKAARLLGFRPATPFDEGIRKFVEWFRAAQAVPAA
jgi:UDP-glucuronate 4-epimerase